MWYISYDVQFLLTLYMQVCFGMQSSFQCLSHCGFKVLSIWHAVFFPLFKLLWLWSIDNANSKLYVEVDATLACTLFLNLKNLSALLCVWYVLRKSHLSISVWYGYNTHFEVLVHIQNWCYLNCVCSTACLSTSVLCLTWAGMVSQFTILCQITLRSFTCKYVHARGHMYVFVDMCV